MSVGAGDRSKDRLVSVDLPPVPDAVEGNLLADNIITNTIGPDFETPLTNPFTLQLLDPWRGAERIDFQALDCF